MKIGIIGGGNMGSAIAAGLVATGFIPATDITVTSPRQATLDKIVGACPGVVTNTDNAAAVRASDVIILAVKPWMVKPVLEEIAPRIDFRAQTLVSLAATVSLADIDDILRNYSSRRTIVRAIPNTAMAVGQSMTFICHDSAADAARVQPVIDIFNSLGKAAVIPESQLGAAMALCSCGIAYVMRFVRAATEGAVELGIYPDKAKEWFLHTMHGAVELLNATGANPESEIDKVTTPGGLTIRGLNAMEEKGFTAAVVNGLRASVKH
jgi:pyrroline-5-carboxylate reductase